MSVYDLVLKEETDWGDWTVPTEAYPVRSFSVDPGENFEDIRHTGDNRGLTRQFRGGKGPSGSFEFDVYEEMLGLWLLGAGFNDLTTTQDVGATIAYEHAFNIDDDAAGGYSSLSVQKQEDASNAQSLVGVVVNALKFQLVAGEVFKLSGDYFARDEAIVGQNWEDGTSAPAYIASPTYSTGFNLLHFAGGALTLGGTPTRDGTSQQYSVAGGVAQVLIERIEIDFDNGLEYPHFIGDRRPGLSSYQDRAITGRMDIDFSTFTATHYNAMKAETLKTLQLTITGNQIEGAHNAEVILTLPSIQVNKAQIPDITGSQSRRVQSVEFTGLILPATNDDISIFVRDTQSAY